MSELECRDSERRIFGLILILRIIVRIEKHLQAFKMSAVYLKDNNQISDINVLLLPWRHAGLRTIPSGEIGESLGRRLV